MKFKPRKGFNMIHDIKNAILFAAIFAAITDVLLYILVWNPLIPMWASQGFDPNLNLGPLETTTIYGITYNRVEYQTAIAQGIVFTNVVFFELFFVFSCTSEYRPLWEFRNKHLIWATGISFALHILIIFTPLGIAFHVVPLLQWQYWAAIFLGSVFIVPAEETRKYLVRRKRAKDPYWQERLSDFHRN
jgi:magnesium-transporting ATPase (P-type)